VSPTLAQSKARGAPSMRGRMLGVDDVIATTSLSRRTLYRLIALGEIPRGERITQGRVAWAEADILAYLARRRATN
jgi:prophage regulatory protein